MRYLAILLVGFVLFSCKKDKIIIEEFELDYPSYFPEPVYQFTNNEVTKERFELGKKLFFDPILSIDNTISCASCHAQTHGFADHNVAVSTGVNGMQGTRNSPTIANMIWSTSFMWDGGVNHLEMFSIAPITNPVEMNETMVNVMAKLNANSGYKSAFKDAYGIDEITDQALFRSLSVFMAMIVSDDSKYDQYRQGLTSLSSAELSGLNLFRTHCASCHTEPLFMNNGFANNGLDSEFTDLGRGLITQNPADNGKFKVPTLRNIELTYPYMHDGRFWSLEQVLDHYSEGIQESETLHLSLAGGLGLDESEKANIIVFLKTLTDYSLLSNPLFY
jgi:cytochrome c peroxidase